MAPDSVYKPLSRPNSTRILALEPQIRNPVGPKRGRLTKMAPDSVYKPLSRPNSTRILALDPLVRNPVGPMRGRLIEVDLDNPPVYDAISYVWGERKNSGQIFCRNGFFKSSQEIRLSGNGEEVLRWMQDPLRTRLLWIDAICINQTSIEERNCQVALMATIYSKARCVLVWLPCDQKWLPSTASRFWEEYVTKAPWFSRVWTFQEFAFSRDATFYTGCRDINRDWKLPVDNYEIRHYGFMGPHIDANNFWKSSSGTAYLCPYTLLHHSRACFATEPVDKIFGMYSVLSMLPDFPSSLLLPDYRQSAEFVFRMTAAAIIQYTKSLALLLHVPGVRKTSHATSWAIDLTINARTTESHADYNINSSPHRFQFNSDLEKLSVYGIPLGSVAKTTMSTAVNPILPYSHRVWTWVNVKENLIEPMSSLISQIEIPTGIPGYDDPRITIDSYFMEFHMLLGSDILDRDIFQFLFMVFCPGLRTHFENTPKNYFPESLQSLEGFGPIIEKLKSNNLLASERIAILSKFLMSHVSYKLPISSIDNGPLTGKEFFVTDQGTVGITNGFVEVEDKIFAIPDLGTPILVRKLPGVNGYQFVGVARVERITSSRLNEHELLQLQAYDYQQGLRELRVIRWWREICNRELVEIELL
jgi:hypothetical protein